MPVDPRRTHYRVLMIDPTADTEIISVVYRKLAQRYHPDVDASPAAARKMAEINEAYAVLRDARKRALYDADLASRRDRRNSDRLIHRPGDIAYGQAGVPSGPPEGSVLNFGRYAGWTLGQIRRADPDFLEWLMRVPTGRQYRAEIAELLRKSA
ncbi:MAG TPA: DnaJ domain-containing protein [Candidatus Limnocylindrales bacterium]|jgi:curved DNA-binding protein CbpA